MCFMRCGIDIVAHHILMENIATLDLMMKLDCFGGIGKGTSIQ